MMPHPDRHHGHRDLIKSHSSRPRTEVAPSGASPNRSFFAIPPERQQPIFLIFVLLISAIAWLAAWRLRGTVGDPYDLDIFLFLFVHHEADGALLAAGILLVAALLSFKVADRWLERGLRCLTSRPKTVAAAAFLLLAAGSLLVYQNHPLAMDEYAPVFQAKIFAEGEIYGRFPVPLIERLIPPLFLNQRFINASLTSGKVISTYSPGFALLLTPLTLLGATWLLNPLLGAGALLLIAHLARRLIDAPLAPGWAMLFALASPAFTINAFSYYSSTAHLFLNLLFVALLLEHSIPRAFAAGAAGSLALTLHNPVPHALFALPWLVWLVFQRRWQSLGALAVGYLPLSLLLGFGWVKVRASIAAENALGAAETSAPVISAAGGGAVPFISEIRSFFGVLHLPSLDFLGLRYLATLELFLWAVPGLPILAMIGLYVLRRKTPVLLLGASAVVTFVFYLFVYFDQGHGWGYRYFHSAWGVLPLLGAAALSVESSRRWRRLVGTVALLSLLAGTALRCAQVHSFIDRHLDQVAKVPGDVPQVRFLNVGTGYYTNDLIQNDPFLRTMPWTFVSFGRARDARMMRQAFRGSHLAVDLGNSTAWTVLPQTSPSESNPIKAPAQSAGEPVLP